MHWSIPRDVIRHGPEVLKQEICLHRGKIYWGMFFMLAASR